MESFVWIGFGAFFVVSLVAGVRLVALSTRTRQLPELLIGIGVLGIGPVGFGLITLGELLSRGQPGVSHGAFAVAVLAISAGVFATYVFTWRVYHPTRAAVRWLVWVAGSLLAVSIAGEAVESGFRNSGYATSSYVLRTTLQIGCLLWSAFEALLYWRRMRRRLRIGLAEPLVANRFFLWGLAAGAAGVGSAIGLGTQLATGLPPLEIGWLLLSSSLHGLTAAAAMWLAFLPPQRYRRFIESRAAASS